jgi:predicted nucleic acid-binding protein
MFVVDTNVVSELMRSVPDPRVLQWFADRSADDMYLTSVNEAELRTGAAIMPEGKRRDSLIALIDAMISEDFSGRVLPFDSNAARAYADISLARRRAGHPILGADCQIAAIALACGATLATRNVADFEGCAIPILNPWGD